MGSAQRIQDGRRHHEVAQGHLAYLCPESMSSVDGATWDRCYIYAIPRYPPLPAPASLCCMFRSITAYFCCFVLLRLETEGQNGRRQDELKPKEKSAHHRGEADTQGGSRLWRLVSMNLPRNIALRRALVMRVDDECHLHCTHTPHKCAPDHSARRWLKSSLPLLLSAGPRLCISGQSWSSPAVTVSWESSHTKWMRGRIGVVPHLRSTVELEIATSIVCRSCQPRIGRRAAPG